MKKRIVILLFLVLAVGAGIYGKQWYSREFDQEAGDTINIYGSIDIRDANLAFNEQERITEVLVEEGKRVEKGQVLARLKTDRLEAATAEAQARMEAQQQIVNRLKAGSRPQEIAQARAEVEAARIKVANAELVRTRQNKTSGTGATSKQALDDAQSNLMVEKSLLKVREKALDLLVQGPRQEDIAAAERQLEALQANLQLLAIRMADMTLTAPSAGIIQSRILEPGEMAGPNHPVFTLALTDPKWVRAYVPEPELGRIHLGMKAKVFSDSLPDTAVDGWIGYISPIAEFTPRTVQTEDLRTQLVYETRVFVHDAENRLRLGMPVTVTIDRNAAQDGSTGTEISPHPVSGPGA